MIEPLRDSALLAEVFDAYPAPTLLVDDDVRVLHANRTARELLGLRGDGSEALLTRGGADVSEIVRLRSLLPMCAGCRKIRDGENYWRTVEEYFKQSLDIDFSHSFCEACAARLYPEMGQERPGP